MQMARRLGMDRDPVCTACGKLIDTALRLLDHQMHVKKALASLSDGSR